MDAMADSARVVSKDQPRKRLHDHSDLLQLNQVCASVSFSTVYSSRMCDMCCLTIPDSKLGELIGAPLRADTHLCTRGDGEAHVVMVRPATIAQTFLHETTQKQLFEGMSDGLVSHVSGGSSHFFVLIK